MRILIILIMVLFTGCATTLDAQALKSLNDRLTALEKSSNISGVKVNEYRQVQTMRLTDAQKDFIIFMLEYLREDEDEN